MALPQFQTDDFALGQTISQWSNMLNPLLANPVNTAILLKSVSLKTGANVINHGLSRKLQGWVIIRQRAVASFYDTQDSNQMPALTLQLTSSAAVVVDIMVF